MTVEDIALAAARSLLIELAKYLASAGVDPRAELNAAYAAGDIAADAAEKLKFGGG